MHLLIIYENDTQAVNMDGASLDKFIEHQVATSGWIVAKEDGSIVLPQNEFNRPELKKNPGENVSLEHIARIFPILGWTSLWGLFEIFLFVPLSFHVLQHFKTL